MALPAHLVDMLAHESRIAEIIKSAESRNILLLCMIIIIAIHYCSFVLSANASIRTLLPEIIRRNGRNGGPGSDGRDR